MPVQLPIPQCDLVAPYTHPLPGHPPCLSGLAKYNTADMADAEPSPITNVGGAGGGAPGGLGASAALLSDTTGLVGTSYYIS